MRLLFIQLPRLDPDITSPGENLMSAAACLRATLERSAESPNWDVIETPNEQNLSSDAALTDCICKLNPDVVAATCYLWNIERTLHLLERLKKHLPKIKTVIGGPDVATDHPLLPLGKSTSPADVFVVGEGETVFPEILRFFRTGNSPDYRIVNGTVVIEKVEPVEERLKSFQKTILGKVKRVKPGMTAREARALYVASQPEAEGLGVNGHDD